MKNIVVAARKTEHTSVSMEPSDSGSTKFEWCPSGGGWRGAFMISDKDAEEDIVSCDIRTLSRKVHTKSGLRRL